MANWLQRFATGGSSKVFGAPLVDVIRRSPTGIPVVLKKCIEYLDSEKVLRQEGLFRKSGNHTQIQEMKQRIDKGEDVDLSKIQDPHTVCGLMKQYLRELPEPLCTFELYDCFIAAIGIPDPTMCMQQLSNVLDMLPLPNQMLTKYLVTFIRRVASFSDENFMTPSNLATVFAPNLIRPPGNDLSALVEYTPHSNRTMEMLILHYDELVAKLPDPSPITSEPIPEILQKTPWNVTKILPSGWKSSQLTAPAPAPSPAAWSPQPSSTFAAPAAGPPPLPPHNPVVSNQTLPPLPPHQFSPMNFYAPPLPPQPSTSTSSPLPPPPVQSYSSPLPPSPQVSLGSPTTRPHAGTNPQRCASYYAPSQLFDTSNDPKLSFSVSSDDSNPPSAPPPLPPMRPAYPSIQQQQDLTSRSALQTFGGSGSDIVGEVPRFRVPPARPPPIPRPSSPGAGRRQFTAVATLRKRPDPTPEPLTGTVDDSFIPRRGARVIKKEEIEKSIPSAGLSSSSSTPATPTLASNPPSIQPPSQSNGSTLIRPFVPSSVSARGPSPSAPSTQSGPQPPSPTPPRLPGPMGAPYAANRQPARSIQERMKAFGA